MNIFEKITESEQNLITNYIEAYAGYDGETVSLKAPLSHILRFWSENKIDLFNAFGGELILSKKVVCTKPEEELESDISHMLNTSGSIFYNAYSNFIRTKMCHSAHRYDLSELLYCHELATNVWTGESFTIPTNGDGSRVIAISKGCKISKVLGKIAREFNIAGYEEFRIAHSQCLNQKKLTGELCVSIHPLDYMTMSDNNCDWSSCMSWADCGDYRQGTVEMMNSPVIVVAYLKASEDMSMPFSEGTWNSKKWRSLFIVTPHIITGIREYPYMNEELNSEVLKWLRELVTVNTSWGPFEQTMSKVRNHTHNMVASMDKTVYLDFNTHFMYNDFYAERPAYLSHTIPDFYELCFSGESECMECGEDISHYDACDGNTNALACNKCENVICCSECGDRINAAEVVHVDGYAVCPYCYENHFVACNICEETHHESDVYTIYLSHEGQRTCYHISVCCECRDDEFCDRFGEISTESVGFWDTRRSVNVENFASVNELDVFDIWNEDDYEMFKKVILEARAEDET